MSAVESRMPSLVDTHAHLADPELAADLPGVLGRALEAAVTQVIVVGTDADDSEVAQGLAARNAGLYAAVGIHPNHAAEADPGDWERILGLVGRPKVVAIGETGLDRYRDRTPFEQQVAWFDRHLRLAFERDLPVIIHCRESEPDIIAQLERLGRPVRGVLHSFAGTWDEAQAFLGLGLHLSFAGMVTFTNKSLDGLRETAARVPIDRLLVETDSPYLSPHPHRGRRNEPARVRVTAERLAGLRGIPTDELARITTANARRLFGLPDEDGSPGGPGMPVASP